MGLVVVVIEMSIDGVINSLVEVMRLSVDSSEDSMLMVVVRGVVLMMVVVVVELWVGVVMIRNVIGWMIFLWIPMLSVMVLNNMWIVESVVSINMMSCSVSNMMWSLMMDWSCVVYWNFVVHWSCVVYWNLMVHWSMYWSMDWSVDICMMGS